MLFRRKRCIHPQRCRDILFNGVVWVTQCGLCGEIFTTTTPSRRIIMATTTLANLDPAQLKTDVENVINVVDTVLTFVGKYENLLPANVVTGVDDLQTFLNLVQKFLAA